MKMLQAYTENFNPELYLEAKLNRLHTVLSYNNRKTLIVGVSGGIDSAVVLAMLTQLKQKYPEAGYDIVPVIAPIFGSNGTTGQLEASQDAYLVCQSFGYMEPILYELGDVANEYKYNLEIKTEYVQQQVDYWLRPTAFYKVAMEHEDSILVSTTNYSEYVTGWFSQYLDILGVHPIIDIRKGQVYDLARYLNVPEKIIEAAPVGGLASGGTDEELLGFTYEDLDKYLSASEKVESKTLVAITDRIESSAFKRFRFNPDFINAVSVFHKLYGDD